MIEKPVCLLFGGNALNAGVEHKFHKWGCEVVTVDWNDHPDVKGDLHLQLDVKQPAPIIDALRSLNLIGRVKTGFTSIDVAVPSLAAVLRECGLAVNSERGLDNCFSKGRMTSVWHDAGLLNRDVQRFKSWSDDIAIWNRNQKLIIKPDNAASSRGITVLDVGSPLEEVALAFSKALDNASDREVVVEEFVDGTEFTVEMLGDGVGNVAVYAISKKQHTKNTDRNRIAVKLHYNSINKELQEKISSIAIECYKSLGFCNTLGHLEILQKHDGSFSPVEIGARSSGFIASDLVDVASGRDFLGDLCVVQHGGTVPNGLREQSERSAMYYFYDLPAGSTIVKECSLLDYCDAKIATRFSSREELYVGHKIDTIDNDNARLGFEVLEGPKELMTEGYIAEAERAMLSEMVVF